MPKFRKKPVVIEAWQWHGQRFGEMKGVCQCDSNTQPHLHTAHENWVNDRGQMVLLSPGDWIIPETSRLGRYYPCKPDIFEKTYEPMIIVPPDLDAAIAEEYLRAPGHATYSGEGHVEARMAEVPAAAKPAYGRKVCAFCRAHMATPCHNEEWAWECVMWAKIESLTDVEAEPAGQAPIGEGTSISEGDPRHPDQRATRFRGELEQLINSHSRENGSDTPARQPHSLRNAQDATELVRYGRPASCERGQ